MRQPLQQLVEEIEEQALSASPTAAAMLQTVHEQNSKSDSGIDTPLAYGHFYINALNVAPLKLNLTVQMSAACDEPEMQKYHASNALIGLALQLLSLQVCNSHVTVM